MGTDDQRQTHVQRTMPWAQLGGSGCFLESDTIVHLLSAGKQASVSTEQG